jgi:hypothetical protein
MAMATTIERKKNLLKATFLPPDVQLAAARLAEMSRLSKASLSAK